MKIHISAMNLQISVHAESEDETGCDLYREDGPVSVPPLLFQYSVTELSQFIDVAALIRETGSLAGMIRRIEAQLLEAATVQ